MDFKAIRLASRRWLGQGAPQRVVDHLLLGGPPATDGVLDELGDVRVKGHGGTCHNTMMRHLDALRICVVLRGDVAENLAVRDAEPALLAGRPPPPAAPGRPWWPSRARPPGPRTVIPSAARPTTRPARAGPAARRSTTRWPTTRSSRSRPAGPRTACAAPRRVRPSPRPTAGPRRWSSGPGRSAGRSTRSPACWAPPHRARRPHVGIKRALLPVLRLTRQNLCVVAPKGSPLA
jgi:hypothetical protein